MKKINTHRNIIIINTGFERQTHRANDEPKWFSYPFEATYDEVIYSRNPFLDVCKALLRRMFRPHARVTLLVFNPSLNVLACALFPRILLEYVCLYQWIWDGNSSHKKMALRFMLWRAQKILVYDRNSEILLADTLGLGVKTIRYPIYTDTDFFEPQATRPSQPIYLCVGDHCRNELLLAELARRLPDRNFIRVSRNKNDDLSIFPPNVRVHQNVTFECLKALYSQAAICLVLTNETRFPVGITAIAEAIATRVPVLCPVGSGTGFFTESEWVRFYSPGTQADDLASVLLDLEATTNSESDSNSQWITFEQCVDVICSRLLSRHKC